MTGFIFGFGFFYGILAAILSMILFIGCVVAVIKFIGYIFPQAKN